MPVGGYLEGLRVGIGREDALFQPSEESWLFVQPKIAGLIGVKIDDTVNGVIVEHMRFRPAGFEVGILLFRLVEQTVNHRTDQ
jgi:hypothetical protein